MSTIFVTFMYGFSIPILFPIAAFTFFNFYITEKFLIAYYYRKPPMLDDKLNNVALSMMRWAPLYFLLFGYWAMGNKQIFENEVLPQPYANAPIVTGHTGLPYMGPDLPLLIAAVILIFCLIFSPLVKKCLVKVHLADAN